MKTTINPRLRRLLMACFTSLILATASSLHAEENTQPTYTIKDGVASGIFSNLNSVDYGGAIINGGSPIAGGSPSKPDESMTILAGTSFEGNSGKWGGAIYNTAEMHIEDGSADEYTTFTNNSVSTNGGAIHQNAIGSLYIGDYTRFSSNSTVASGSAIHARGGFTTGDNIIIEDGKLSGWGGGAVYISYAATDDVPQAETPKVEFGKNAQFLNNEGGAIHNADSAQLGELIIGAGALFSGNYSTNYWQAGALNNWGQATITDTTFTANLATGGVGGAIVNASTLTYNVTTNILNKGNKAQNDAAGGFLYAGANSSTTFDIAANATLTIGDGTADSDSIASADATAVITKKGTGTMDVKSSMEHYTGTVNVEAGTLKLSGTVGASAITVADGAILHLNNADIINTTVNASEILVTGNNSFDASSLGSDKAQIKLSADSNLTISEETAKVMCGSDYKVGQVEGAENATLTYTHSVWAGAASSATTPSTKGRSSTPSYAFSADNATLTDLIVSGTNVLLSDQLTITFEMPSDFDQSTGFIFTFEFEGVTGVAGDFDRSKVSVIMGDGSFGGSITGVSYAANGNLVLEGTIAPEPSTATLSLLALAGLLARRRRQSA